MRTDSPNKLFDTLSAGIPVIVNSSGWTKNLVEECGCGAYVDPDNPQKLSNLILKWKSDKSLLVKMGLSARHIAEKNYDKSILCKSLII